MPTVQPLLTSSVSSLTSVMPVATMACWGALEPPSGQLQVMPLVDSALTK